MLCRHRVVFQCASVGVLLLLLLRLVSLRGAPLGPALLMSITPPLVDGKYELTEHIKSGGYGAVYSGRNTQDGTPIAAKLELQGGSDGVSVLAHEYEMMMKVQGIEGIPRAFAHQHFSDILLGQYQVLVMQKLGRSIRSLTTTLTTTESHKGSTTLKEDSIVKNVLLFAVQSIQRLEDLHNKGMIHNDIKPENFLMGVEGSDSVNGGANTVYIIDFGIASMYKLRDLHVMYTDGHERRGTSGYQSLHNLLGEAPSRRDDMESLGYCILSLYPHYTLPWAHLKSSGTQRADATRAIMMETTIADLCSNIPNEFCAYFRHIKALGFYERPNYEYLKKQFISLYERRFGGKIETARFVYS